jgi:hypothetical protein
MTAIAGARGSLPKNISKHSSRFNWLNEADPGEIVILTGTLGYRSGTIGRAQNLERHSRKQAWAMIRFHCYWVQRLSA